MALLIAGCGGGGSGTEGQPPAQRPTTKEQPPAPELGLGDGSPGSVTLTEIATKADKLYIPRDLAFNPVRPEELWVVSSGDDSVVIVHDATSDARVPERRKDGYALHFMAKPAAIAFGANETTFGLPGTFATCGESRNTYDGTQPANDFMGPALWSSDLTIFAKKNPNGLGSHLDMLHNSPNCMGIAHVEANVYWTFDGLWGSVSKYDFKADNGVGNDDHSDGVTYRFLTGELTYREGVPSHLAYDGANQMLYIADTGGSRIVMLDTTTGTMGKSLPKKESQGVYKEFVGATTMDVVPAGTSLEAPSGLKLVGDHLLVSDNATGVIWAFSKDGVPLQKLDTGLGPDALAGMAMGPDAKLYFVDMRGHRVLRVDPKP